MPAVGQEIGMGRLRPSMRSPQEGNSKELLLATTGLCAESGSRWRTRFLGKASQFARAALFAAILGGPAVEAAASDPLSGVVASIRPVHSLVGAVMSNAGEPELAILGRSEHDFDLRPSIAAMLQSSRLIFVVDETLETGLLDAAGTLAPEARIVILSDAPGVVRRALREGGAFEADHRHDHGHHGEERDGEEDGHEQEDGHAHEEEDHGHEDEEHGHDEDEHADEKEEHGHDEEGHDGDGHAESEQMESGFDPHIWIDPENAAAMARLIASELAELDPAGAADYESNAEDLVRRLAMLNEEIKSELAPVQGLPFIVFHDAYRYFEDRYGLSAAGSAVLNPDISPSARRILELRERIRELGVTCVIGEPNLNRRVIDTVSEGLGVQVGIVDHTGAALEEGPDLYFKLIRGMASAFKGCLSTEG